MNLNNNEKESKNHRHHHHSYNKSISYRTFFNKNTITIICILFALVLCVLLFIDKKTEESIKTTNNYGVSVFPTVDINKYDGIITIIDGEGENTFTENWGDLISKGYPICSNLVIDNIGEDGYMDWDTIDSLSDVGVSFIFHENHAFGKENIDLNEVEKYIKNGITKFDEHQLDHSLFVWSGAFCDNKTTIGNKYFAGGFCSSNATDTLNGNNENTLNIKDYPDASNYSLAKLVSIIDTAKKNNGWAVLFTRNNSEYMNEEQLSIFEKAFEYAKENNVGIVSPFEGFDLYFNNGLNQDDGLAN